MRRAPARLASLAAALLLAACADGTERSADEASAAPESPTIGGTAGKVAKPQTEAGTTPETETPEPAAAESLASALPVPGTEPAAAPIPHIYMALQPAGPGRPTSVVFAIDAARDGTPSDDPAIRLTPDGGRCNPQEMQRYEFPAETSPAVSEAEQARGLTPRTLPDFLAATVTGRLIDAGLAGEPEDTRALNICTRKLWERLVVAENSARLTSGQ